MFLIPRDYWEVKRGGHGKLSHATYKGRGVFAKHDIPAGTVIGDYLGKIVRPEDEDEEKHGLYYMWYNEKASILADARKEGIHLLNHSCAPNCWLYPYQGHALFIATRHIFKGEEMTVCYLLGTPEDEELVCQHTCKCGAPNCSGTFHNSDEVSARWEKFEAKHHQERYNKKVPVPFGKDLPPLPSYPKQVVDDPSFHLFGSLKKPPFVCAEKSLPPLRELRRRLRQTGRCLRFKNVNVTVYGIVDKEVLLLVR